MLHNESLAQTIDYIDDSFYFHNPLPQSEKVALAQSLAERQGLPGSYAGMFAPAKSDFDGIRLYTGEKITSKAAISHMLGEETCRILLLLDVPDPGVTEALGRATSGMLERLDPDNGRYCCGKCSVSLLRHVAAGGLNNNEARLTDGLKELGERRDGSGRWRTYPFYYTLLALSEIDNSLAQRELQYAAPVCEKLLGRRHDGDAYAVRQRDLCCRVLEMC